MAATEHGTPRIYSLRKAAKARDPIPPGAMRVDRKTPWGNPYRLEREADRDHVIAQYNEYARERLEREPDWLEPLRGHDLVCWCQSPSDEVKKACHAEILLALLRETEPAAEDGADR